MRTGSLAVVLVMLFAALAGCAPSPFLSNTQRMMLSPARDAEGRGDFDKAFREYQRAAEKGIAFAQYRLARLYEQGRGTAQDDAEAVRWYRAAAEQGYPPAQIALGKRYEQGSGVPQDEAAALALFEKAAEYERSVKYWESPPHPPAVAHARAGRMIEQGRGRQRDSAAAARYFEYAAKADNPDAQFGLAGLYAKGEGVAAADPAAAQRLYAAAAVNYQELAETGDGNAQNRLGQMLVDGLGVPKDVTRGVWLLERAAEQGNSPAQARLGQLFEQGEEGLPADPARAAHYYQMAIDAGYTSALYKLASLYASGEGVPADGRRAAELYQQAAATGQTRAYGKLGDLYAGGELVPQDHAVANRWYSEGARHGDGRAALKLAEAYERGLGVAPAPIEALTWYNIAQALGEERAADRIERLAGELEPVQVEQARAAADAWQRQQPST